MTVFSSPDGNTVRSLNHWEAKSVSYDPVLLGQPLPRKIFRNVITDSFRSRSLFRRILDYFLH